MKTAIMQPYLFPYIGYFQLIHAADLFVIGDDVQYIKGGWINRNRILRDGQDDMITFSVAKGSSTERILERFYSSQHEQDCRKLLGKLEYSYRKAPYYNDTLAVVKEVLSIGDLNVAGKNTSSLKLLCGYLGIETPFALSSDIPKPEVLTRDERIVLTMNHFRSSVYINPIGGREIYSKEEFAKRGIDLYYIRSRLVEYPQLDHAFVPWLSIIDVLMFNPLDEVRNMLDQYELI